MYFFPSQERKEYKKNYLILMTNKLGQKEGLSPVGLVPFQRHAQYLI